MKKKAIYPLVLLLLLAPFAVFAGQTVWQKTVMKANITSGYRMVVKDLTSGDETSGNNGYYGATRTGLVTLVYGREKHTDVASATAWSYKVVYNITFNGPGGQAQTFSNQELYISYAGSASNHVIEDLKVYGGVPSNADVTVTSIVSTGTVPVDVRLELAISADKARYLSYAASNFLFNYEIVGNDVELFWDYFPGAESYELEWVFVDVEDPNSAAFNPSVSTPLDPFEYYDAVRVTTANQHYKVQRTYPHGRLFFRLRPVGVFTEFINNGNYTYRKDGPWINTFYDGSTSMAAHYYISNPFEIGKTWQSVITYAEQGKSKEVVTYYDASSRNRQTVVNLNTDGTVIVSETKFDYEGRPVVQILPTPIAGTSLSFKTDFTKNGSGSIYSAADFDKASSPGNLSTSTGAGKYYSTSNDLSSSLAYIPNYDYIPTAGGYPFTQVRYMRDNSGRVERSSGLGEDHLLFGEHDVKYYYVSVSSTELHRLFGENVGEAKYYKKVISIDPNGQVSVAYQDNTGKTIATALLGQSPDNVKSFDYITPETRTVNLEANNVPDAASGTWTVTFPKFNEVPNNEHIFSYNAYAQINGVIAGQSRCFNCSYDFTFYIEGPDGQRVELYDISGSGASYNATDKVLTAHYGQDCDYTTDPYSDLIGMSAEFEDIGTYTIYKILKQLEPDFTDVTLTTQLTSSTSLVDIQTQYNSNFDYSNCNITCEQTCADVCPGVDCNDCLASCSEGLIDAFSEAVDYLAENSCEGYLVAMLEQIRPGGFYFENNDPSNSSDAFWEILESSGRINNLTDFDNVVLGYTDWEDARDNWAVYGEHWIDNDNIIESHPEFCVYGMKCVLGAQLMEDAKQFEARMFFIQGWNAAATLGYLAPFTTSSVTVTYTTSSGTQNVNILSQANSQDPTTTFVGTGGSSFLGIDLYDAIYDKLYDYKNGNSLWEFTDKDCAEHGGALYGAIDISDPDEYDKWRWYLFRSMYIDLREEVFNQVLITFCGSNDYIDDDNGYLINQAEAVFKHRGYIGNPTNAIVEDLIEDAAIIDQITTCQGQVGYWLGSIKSYLYFNKAVSPCMPSNADTDGEFVTWWASVESDIETRLIALCNDNTIPRDHLGLPIISDAVLASKPASGTIPAYLIAQGCTLTCASLAESNSCSLRVSRWMEDIYSECLALDPDPSSTDYTTIKGYLESYCETYSNILYSNVEITGKRIFTNSDLIALQTYLDGRTCTSGLSEASISVLQPTECFSTLIDYIDTYLLPSSPPTPPSFIRQCSDVEEGFITDIDIVTGGIVESYTSTHRCNGFYLYDKCGDAVSWDDIDDIEEIIVEPILPFTLPSGYDYQGATLVVDLTSSHTFTCDAGTPTTITVYVLEIVGGGKTCSPLMIEEAIKQTDITYEDWADEWHEKCKEMMEEIALYQAGQEYQRLLDEEYTLYVNGRYCNPTEEFKMTCEFSEYHHTLYYYDQSGHLVQTVPPEGVAYFDGTPYFDSDGNFNKGNNYYPVHRMASKYQYNSIGQVLHQKTPDGGETDFWYNKASQLRLSQNSKQAPNNEYSFTSYDKLGRIVNAGEIVDVTLLSNLNNYLSSASYVNGIPKEFMQTIYDGGPNGRNRLSNTVAVDFSYNPVSQNGEFIRHCNRTSYAYDIQGNVKSLYQELGIMGGLTGTGNGKSLNYTYDLISGNVHRVRYQPGELDEFNHRYRYDADNRLVSVNTSKDGWLWEEDARYFYYPHGPLARVEIGEDKLQGLDYYYTIHGWLKGINTPDGNYGQNVNITASTDPGLDGIFVTGNHDRWGGRDEFSLGLGYYESDYAPINGSWAAGAQNSPWAAMEDDLIPDPLNPPPTLGLYNGNIAWMATQVNQFDRQSMGTALEAYAFQYDQLHRIKQAKRWQHDGTGWGNTNEWRYHTNYAFDKNGNLNTLQRHSDDGTLIDNFSYTYQSSGGNRANNKLLGVGDAVSSGVFAGDIDDQPPVVTGGGTHYNYGYDEIGNLLRDDAEGIDEIVWNVQGKITDIKYAYDFNGSHDIEFVYDGMGQRVAKIVKPHAGLTYPSGEVWLEDEDKWTETYYVRDATGNIMATYERRYVSSAVDFALIEQPIYGSSRLGILNRHINLVTTDGWEGQQRILGQKQYELSNHLGNVNAVISDVRLGIDEYTLASGSYGTATPDGFADYYRPKVVSATDYYPYGWTLPNRSFNSGDYRFGFQGQESDNEVKGMGSSIAWEKRIYDPRLGRWLEPDGASYYYPAISSYSFCANSPVYFKEVNGDFFGTAIGMVVGGIVGGVSAAARGEDVWQGIGDGVVVGGIAGMIVDITVATAGVGTAALGTGLLATGITTSQVLATGFVTGAAAGMAGEFTNQTIHHYRDGASYNYDAIAANGAIGGVFGGALSAFGIIMTNNGGPRISFSSGKVVTNKNPNAHVEVGEITGKMPALKGVNTSRINIAKGTTRFTPLRNSGKPISAGWKHTVEGHFNREIGPNRSVFSITKEEVSTLLQSKTVTSASVTDLGGGQYQRIVNTGTTVGNASLNQGGNTTTWIKVLTDYKGNLITTYPVAAP